MFLAAYIDIMAATYLIDGYNLAYALALIRRVGTAGELRAARRQLLALLEEWRGVLAGQITVVFDAKRKPRRSVAEETSGSIEVLYAVGREADDLIEELIARPRSEAPLIVVSDDHRLQRAARHGRAQAMGCQAFLDLLEQPGARRSPHLRDSDKPAELSDEDRRSYLDAFRDVQIPKELRDTFDEP